ncbi:MAG: hypothetical protein ACRC2K_10775 [Clostridium sp.]
MKRRCGYCGKKLNGDLIVREENFFCNKDCIEEYDKFKELVERKSKSFIISIVLSLALMFIGMLTVAINEIIGVVVISIGTLILFGSMIVFPFATPETVKLIGIKKSVMLVRILAIIAIIISIIPMIIS